MSTEKQSEADQLWNMVDERLRDEDVASAIFPLRRLSNLNDSSALALLGLAYEHGAVGVPANQALALRKYREAIFQGDEVLAHFGMARAYFNGEGTERDLERSVFHMLKAADRGHPEASLYAGLFLTSGTGVPRDLDRAASYFRVAAAHGFLAAESNLGKWEVRTGHPLRGFWRLLRGSIKAFEISIRNPQDRRLLLLSRGVDET